MLESPWMLRYSSYGGHCVRDKSVAASPRGSDKPSAAENQQERLLKIGWITGFVDGEGCFSIHLVRQPSRDNRKGYKTGFQVAHQFVVTQGARSVECLRMLKDFFEVGRLYENRRFDNHKESLWQFVVAKRSDLIEKIIPFFEKHSLRTAKQSDFVKFSTCVRLMEANEHLTVGGLIKVVEIMQTMNHRKSRIDLIRILRDYTPNTGASSVKI